MNLFFSGYKFFVGEIRYGKNGHTIATLMYVDKTLPLWAFFDVYGSTQKIKSLGKFVVSCHITLRAKVVYLHYNFQVIGIAMDEVEALSGINCIFVVAGFLSGAAAQMGRRSSLQPSSAGSGGGGGVSGAGPTSPGGVAGLTVALPPPRSPVASPASSNSNLVSPPPRPPPPRQSSSPSSRRASSPLGGVPPSLPPKQYQQQRPVPAQPPMPGTILVPTQLSPARSATAAPMPAARSPRGPAGTGGGTGEVQPTPPPPPKPQPAVPSATAGTSPTHTLPQKEVPRPTHAPGAATDQSEEAADNASNECSVCLDNAVDCVIYTCGHMCVCYRCALDIKQNKGECPICRRDIVDIIKIFRS